MQGTVPAVWQISAGPSKRSYADVLFKYGVALIGPGDAGPWNAARDDSEFEGIFVRRFAGEISSGDVVLMRCWIATIAAVGLVAGDYQYVNAFDDVNGWDLQHTRRVRWYKLPLLHSFATSLFGANPPRCSRIWNEDVLDFAARFIKSEPTHWKTSQLPSLPIEDEPLDVVPEHLARIIARVADLAPLFQDRTVFGEMPSEDELIVHFVVPFLYALGWPPERLGIQWRRIDVAVFRALPRTPNNCIFVIEAKRLGAGVEGALEQAKGYARSLGTCKTAIVTDGVRYRMYDGANDYEPIGYANLVRLKRPAATLFAKLRRP